jgi:hypothetical protein
MPGNIFEQFEKLKQAVYEYAEENGFCIVCQNHPSSGHSKACPLYEEPEEAGE